MTNKTPRPNSSASRNPPPWATDLFDVAKQPLRWRVVARRLRASANILIEKESLVADRFWRVKHSDVGFDEVVVPEFEAAYLLIALSIENLLKGLIVAKGIVEFTGQSLPKQLQNHDLTKLHRLAKPWAILSTELLESLTYMARWRARYPIPLKVEDFWPCREDGTPKSTSLNWSKSHRKFLVYADKLDCQLTTLLKPSAEQP